MLNDCRGMAGSRLSGECVLVTTIGTHLGHDNQLTEHRWRLSHDRPIGAGRRPGHYGPMPPLLGPALPGGSLRALEQPELSVDDQLLLRPWRREDAATLVAAFAVPDIQRWHLRQIDDEEEAITWVDGWRRNWDQESDASWAVVDTADDRVVGQAGLRTVMLFAATAQLSYWVLPDARGAGVAARAARRVSRWAFDVVHLHRLFLVHSTLNTASCRVAAVAGFDLEGTLRDYLLHTDGWHDVHMHGRLAG